MESNVRFSVGPDRRFIIKEVKAEPHLESLRRTSSRKIGSMWQRRVELGKLPAKSGVNGFM